jgi:hypothetical protein
MFSAWFFFINLYAWGVARAILNKRTNAHAGGQGGRKGSLAGPGESPGGDSLGEAPESSTDLVN